MSFETEKDVSRAARGMTVRWPEERQEKVLGGLRRRRRRRAVVRIAAAVLVVTAAGATFFMTRGTVDEAPVVALEKKGEGDIRLGDGSLISLLDEKSSVRMEEDARKKTTLVKVGAGSAKFRVVHDPERKFVVEAGAVSVQVVGTVFTVERSSREIKVSVQQGRVRVVRYGRTTELGDGEAGVFAESQKAGSDGVSGKEAAPAGTKTGENVAVRDVPKPLSAERHEGRAAGDAAKKASPETESPDWKKLAQKGMFNEAYAMLPGGREGSFPSDAGDLLLMADVARLAGHPQGAVAPLKKLVETCRTDPRAPLAAFTLGRVLLDELGDPRGAAAAFRMARDLAPEGPMSEDAMAREVEAYWRAGDTGVARERAGEYLKKYPDGRRVGPVKHYGGLD